MTWVEHHRRSEDLAVAAEAAGRSGDMTEAEKLYVEAAEAEGAAFADLDPSKSRTSGITAVSAVSLYYKGKAFARAETLALECLTKKSLAAFARSQLKALLQSIWSESAITAAGLKFSRRDVLVSVKGGEVLTGGAPLDLILRKVEEVRSLFYRTIEMLEGRQFRTRGGPPIDVQQSYRPWLFQAAPGSYQFAVRLESTAQLEFAIVERSDHPEVEFVTSKFLEIVRAASEDPEHELPRVVPDVQYRNAFIKLTRNLAPTGKSYSSVEIRSAIDPSVPLISLAAESRKMLTESLQKARPSEADQAASTAVALTGVLRAVHLDEDWLEVTVSDGTVQKHIKVTKAGEAIDDLVGPMINRPVVVETRMKPSGRHEFVDIQAVE
jgi:hypothetical protein